MGTELTLRKDNAESVWLEVFDSIREFAHLPFESTPAARTRSLLTGLAWLERISGLLGIEELAEKAGLLLSEVRRSFISRQRPSRTQAESWREQCGQLAERMGNLAPAGIRDTRAVLWLNPEGEGQARFLGEGDGVEILTDPDKVPAILATGGYRCLYATPGRAWQEVGACLEKIRKISQLRHLPILMDGAELTSFEQQHLESRGADLVREGLGLEELEEGIRGLVPDLETAGGTVTLLTRDGALVEEFARHLARCRVKFQAFPGWGAWSRATRTSRTDLLLCDAQDLVSGECPRSLPELSPLAMIPIFPAPYPELQARLLAEGVAPGLSLPLFRGELQDLVESRLELIRHLAEGGPGIAGPRVRDNGTSLHSSPLSGSGPITILIADDDISSRELLCFHLEREGWQCRAVDNGFEAEELLGSTFFDLVLLDIHMPFRSGFEILKVVRERQGRAPKIIMISAQSKDESVIRALDLGADDFIEKPFNPDVVIRRIRRLFSGSAKGSGNNESVTG